MAATKRLKTAQVNLRVDPKLKDAADRAAADDQRSLTSLIEKRRSVILPRAASPRLMNWRIDVVEPARRIRFRRRHPLASCR